eukprot:gene36379-47354_t
MFHLVNAAHSILVRLRDISIGLRDNKSSRIVVECMGPPGNIHVSEGYHPRWDVDSDDDIELYDGNIIIRVEKERNFLNELVERAARHWQLA